MGYLINYLNGFDLCSLYHNKIVENNQADFSLYFKIIQELIQAINGFNPNKTYRINQV